MATTADDLKSFSQFVQEQLGGHDDADSRLPELFDLWMLQNPSNVAHAEDVAAVNASINDFMNGERGTPAGEHSQQLRAEFGIGNE
ncbi:MAG: hypothetical protein ABGZ53_30755 [Fuerstiella sp.]|jgi:hypothetical protein